MSLLKFPALLLALFVASSLAVDHATILDSALDINSWLKQTRRTLHQIPELGSTEYKTSAEIKKILTELNIPFKWVLEKNPAASW